VNKLQQNNIELEGTIGHPEACPKVADPAAGAGSVRVARPWWRALDLLVFAIWTALVCFTLHYHEKWADEAQAWLLARDLDLKTLWLKELRYEGSPGLWHTMLWVAQHVFHWSYSSIGYIGVACAAAGVAFLLWKAPFPRPLRYLLAFSYFIVYQYAVIARPYTLLPLLSFAAAYLFRDRKHPERITLVFVLLAMLTVHGILLSAALGIAYLIDPIKERRMLSLPLRRRYLLCIGIILATFFFLFIILKPTPDVEVIDVKQDPAKYHMKETPVSDKLESIVSGATLDYIVPSCLFLVLASAWCFQRRKLLAFALPTGLLIFFYVKVYGAAHHHGTVFLAAIAGLWIAWPTPEQQLAFSTGERRATHVMVAVLACMFAMNILDAAVAIRNDYRYPYSGAEDAANYLKSVGAERESIFGYMYGVTGVQAYFDHGILSNMPTSYYHHGVPLKGRFIDSDELVAAMPDYLLIHSIAPDIEFKRIDPALNAVGYRLVHFSDGYMFFKQAVWERQVYFIYHKVGY
jgi:hypothetical protein